MTGGSGTVVVHSEDGITPVQPRALRDPTSPMCWSEAEEAERELAGVS